MLAVGSGVALATASTAQATFPGANGRIAFSSDHGAVAVGALGVWTANPDGSNLTQLAPAAAQQSWSPDGRRVVFVGSLPAGITVMQADGTGRVAIPAALPLASMSCRVGESTSGDSRSRAARQDFEFERR